MMKRSLSIFLLFSLVLLASCGGPDEHFDPLKRSQVDGLNKSSFVCRYKDPVTSVALAEKALRYVEDSIPDYDEGRLRAWNNLAFGHYMLTQIDEADSYADSVMNFDSKAETTPAERAIAMLIRARILQSACRIADSYQMLYDVDHSGVLQKHKGHYLYNYALSEYYIASLTLNYSYRHDKEADVATQIAEIEQHRDSLRCDYAQDLMLNYALAYGYSRLLDSVERQSHNLGRSLDYCIASLRQMTTPESFSLHELANIVQMLAFLTSDEGIRPEAWNDNMDRWGECCDLMAFNYGIVFDSLDDIPLRLFQVSSEQFCQLDDPTQRMASHIATGYYLLQIGDTLGAQECFLAPLGDTILPASFIPRFEQMLYEGLLISGAGTPEMQRQWYLYEKELSSIIEQNQKADFLLQTELTRSKSVVRMSLIFMVVLAVLLVALGVLLVKLNRNRHALKQEALALKQAKQKDVERIANVETCLSVLRHDITPFISYLRNKNLPAELRQEVQEQLFRTFDNIKSWTNLSIPTGLQYKGSVFSIQEAFDLAEEDVNNIRRDQLQVIFEPSQLKVNADKLLLEILLRNLVNNAIQHTPSGRVRIRAEREGDFVHVSVSDTGSGMDEEMIESLFRADRQPRQEGDHSGFGLILSRYIIKKHDDNTRRGCRIWAESQPGQGSTFHFLIAAA